MDSTFFRMEKKFIITENQYNSIIDAIRNSLMPDKYPRYTISSLYYDTDDFKLIKASIEKPVFKEKLRIRSYDIKSDNIFIELKRKYNGVTYKRRVNAKRSELESFFTEPAKTQVAKEIQYFQNINHTKPKVLIAYDREAFSDPKTDLRLTFDTNLRFRTYAPETMPTDMILFMDGLIIMEIKSTRPFPLWLVKILSENKIYSTSFSKYGFVYKNFILRK